MESFKFDTDNFCELFPINQMNNILSNFILFDEHF